MEHRLKTWPQYWHPINEGLKTFEVRRDDRGFQKGDVLVLELFDPEKNHYVTDYNDPNFGPKTLYREVTYILTGGHPGINPGFVVMGLKS